MISLKKAEALIEYAMDCCKGKTQGTEVTIRSTDVSTSRFANNGMTQNQAPDYTEISVRVVKDGRQARLSSDDLSQQAIKSLMDDALDTIDYLEADPDLLPLPGEQKVEKNLPKRFDKATAELSADERATAIKEIIEIAEAKDLQAAGIVSSGGGITVIGNSRGLFACHKETQAECSVTMSKNGSTGWAKADEVSFASVDFEKLAERAADKALKNVDPVEIPPGKYRVILEPSAVIDLVSYLAMDFTATSHLDKLSCLLDKLGERVFGENISISDDCRHKLQSGAPFDGEGISRQSLNLVEKGVLNNLVYGRRSARKMDQKTTGHGLPEPCLEGESVANLVIAGGSSSLDKMIAGEERAVLLTRVWYIREVDPAAKIVTGMTRDGSFLIENGKITNAVKNLRFNQSLVELLNNVIALGSAQRAVGGEGFPPAVVPAMLVDKFNFASTTIF